MLKALGLRGKSGSASGGPLTQDEKTERILTEALQFENGLKAMDYVLDDRSPEGVVLLKNHDKETISKVALGVIEFLEATLGFEPETMKRASNTLSAAESMSWKEKQNAEKLKLQTSSIYPPGTEWAVTYAEANLLNALLGLFSESVIEGAKALIKLRRAYHTLDEISKNMERQVTKKASSGSMNLNSLNLNGESSISLASSSGNKFVDIPLPVTNEQEIKDAEVIKKLEKIYKMRKSRIEGNHIGNPSVFESLKEDLGVDQEAVSDLDEAFQTGNPDVATIDEFIHSGVNLCFGILQVVLSLIPPAIGKVLSVVGFKGSREVGLKMVWKAAMERNIHGGIGLLALLVFYDGPFQFTDTDFDVPSTVEINKLSTKKSIGNVSLAASARSIFSGNKIDKVTGNHKGNGDDVDVDAEAVDGDDEDDINSFRSARNDVTSQDNGSELKRKLSRKKMEVEHEAQAGHGDPTILHPGPKLVKALLYARALFPNSALWLLQESRMLASRGKLEDAVTLMDTAKKSNMRQVEALLIFDRAMILVFLHRYERAAEEFLGLIELNAWSHALYCYMAGACYLESYRMCVTGQLVNAPRKGDVTLDKKEWYAEMAEKYLVEAPSYIGRKKFMSKVMPFEKFALRKVNNILKVKEQTGNSFIDSVGTSLVHELAYFWNGYNRMPEEHLKLTINLLGYSGEPGSELAFVNPETQGSYTKIKETREESMIRYTLQSLALRRLGDIKQGIELLDSKVICHLTESGKADYSSKMLKLTENPWCYPVALYERALFAWKLKGVYGLKESMEWLKRSQAFGGDDYELSSRISMKTKAAIDRLEGLSL